MQALPDGTYKITNKKTGQSKIVRPEELSQYGLTAPTQPAAPTQVTTPQPAPSAPVQDAETVVRSTGGEQIPEKSWGGFGSNVLKSAGDTLGGIASGVVNVFNPDIKKNTVANVAKIGLGAAQLLDPTEGNKIANTVVSALPGMSQIPTQLGDSEDQVRALGKFYDNRYGVSDLVKGDTEGFKKKVGDTLYNDPVGAALDASMLLDAGGSAIGKVGEVGKIDALAQGGRMMKDVAEVVDPIRATGKIANAATGGKLAGSAEKAGEVLQDTGKDLNLRSTKASGSQITKFEDLTGQKLKDFMSENGLTGRGEKAVQNAQALIDPLTEEYNGLVRNGQQVDASIYSDALRRKAAQIRDADFSVGAEKTATALEEQAKMFDEKATVNGGKVPVDIIANTKSSEFNAAPGSAMVDPASLNAQKAAGAEGIATLDKIAPGSAETGKKLQALKEYQDIVKKQGNVGLGTQVLNAFKPGMATGGAGALLGSVIPGVGTIGGAAAGTALGVLANNPAVQGVLAGGMEKAGEFLPNIPQVTSTAIDAGKVGSRVNPQTQPSSQSQPESLSQGTQPSPYVAPTKNSDGSISQEQPKTEKPQTLNPYGASPEVIYREYQNALKAGAKGTAANLRTMYQDEIAYQKKLNPDKKNKSAAGLQVEGKAKTGVEAANLIETMLTKDPNLSLRADTPNIDLFKGQDRKLYESAISSITDALGGLRTGASVSKEQQQFYRNMLPKAGDNAATIKLKLDALRREFNGYLNINVTDGLPAVDQTDFSQPELGGIGADGVGQ